MPKHIQNLCYIYGATFSEKAEKNSNVQNVQNSRYISKKELDVHLKRHGNIRDFTCDMCGKGYFRRKVLVNHINMVHGEKCYIRRKCRCRFCDKTFSNNRNRIVHERSVHTGGCTYLAKIFGLEKESNKLNVESHFMDSAPRNKSYGNTRN